MNSVYIFGITILAGASFYFLVKKYVNRNKDENEMFSEYFSEEITVDRDEILNESITSFYSETEIITTEITTTTEMED